ncbi:MAG: isochorismate synthase MenF [Enterococcus sp.]
MNIKLNSLIQEESLSGKEYFSYSRPLNVESLKNLFTRSGSFKGNRFFWQTPDKEFSLLGLGENLLDDMGIITPSKIHRFQQEFFKRFLIIGKLSVNPVLFGGFPFNPTSKKEPFWGALENGYFILPSILIKQDYSGTNVVFTVHNKGKSSKSLLKDFEDLEQRLDSLIKAPIPTFPKNQIKSMEELAINEFKQSIEESKEAIQSNQISMKKVVLARRMALYGDFLSNERILLNLSKQQPHTYLFFLETNQRVFIGATPERLIKATDSLFMTTSIAGSSPRGETKEDDERYGEELLKDLKNGVEHALVAQRLEEQLNTIVEGRLSISERKLLKNRDIQHLCMTFEGRRKEGVSLLDAVTLIHPSPALGGEPKEIAMRWLAEKEEVGRGLYGAPIGWYDLTNGVGEFAVAIRSGVFSEIQGILYAGCGIVANSDADKEQIETSLKFQPMLRGVEK